MSSGHHQLKPDEIVLTRLSYDYKIRCAKCSVWQSFQGSLPSYDMKFRIRLERWQCRLCGNVNETTYELGLRNSDNKSEWRSM